MPTNGADLARQLSLRREVLTRSLECILAGLAPADRAIIEAALQPWARRAYRLQLRDAAVRALVGDHYLECGSGRAATTDCARDLRRYLASGWQHEQGKPPAGNAKRVLMHRILSLNGGRTIAARQIRSVLAGLR